MRISPGTMKASPPTTAPSLPRTRHAQKIASSVDAGPGSRLHAAIASSNSAASSHPRGLDAQLAQQRDVRRRPAEPDDPDPAPLPQDRAQAGRRAPQPSFN